MSSLHFNSDTKSNSYAVYRLTALWALNESGLGGLMHALQIPFTGFFVGGIATVLIGLIAYYSNFSFREIIGATVSVIIVKAIASPQSPITAYVAVAFQGFVGAILYNLISNFTIASMLFGFIALLESAVQKLLITTLLFGKSIWEALNIFFKSILSDLSIHKNISFSFWLIAIYCTTYIIWGLLIGWWISKLPMQIDARAQEIKLQFATLAVNTQTKDFTPSKRKSNWIYIVCILAFIAVVFSINTIDGNQKALYVVLRTVAIVLGWFVFIQPVLKFFIKHYASKQQEQNKFKTQQLIASLPQLKLIAKQSWQLSSITHQGFSRYKEFIFLLIVSSLCADEKE